MHAHGGAYRDYWKSLSPRARAANLAVLNRVHALIVLGEGWREFFVSIGVPRERIVVLPNPVALPAVVPLRGRAARVTFAYLGLIASNKGTFDLVEALALLPDATLDKMRVVIAGNGEHARARAAHRAPLAAQHGRGARLARPGAARRAARRGRGLRPAVVPRRAADGAARGDGLGPGADRDAGRQHSGAGRRPTRTACSDAAGRPGRPRRRDRAAGAR